MSKLPQGWESIRLGDICKPSQYGYTAKAGQSGNIHFLRTTDITSGPIDWNSVPFCNVDEETREKYLLHDGDVVISRAGSVGFSCLIRQPRPSVFASYLIRFRPRINADYFKYFLLTPNYWDAIGEQSLGIAVQNVNASNLSEIEVPVAPEAEQSRIVEKLEELLTDLDAGVAELKVAQKKLGQYRQSLLKAAVEGALTAEWRKQHQPTETGAQLLGSILSERRARWEAKQLAKFVEQGKAPPKDWRLKYPEPVQPDTSGLLQLPESWVWASGEQLCDFITKGTTPPKELDSGIDKSIPFLRVTNLTDLGQLDLVDKVFVSEETHRGFLARSMVYPNDVLMNIVGPPLGQVAVVPNTFAEWNINQAIAIFRAVDGVSFGFVCRYLLSPVAKQWLKVRSKTTAGQTNLTLEVCRCLPFPLPPSSEQEALLVIMENALDAIANQINAIEISLKQSAAQRKNILKAAFLGQLVPQDPNDEPAGVLLERIRAERAEREAMKKPRGRKIKEAR